MQTNQTKGQTNNLTKEQIEKIKKAAEVKTKAVENGKIIKK